jgi:hypothetical protein
MEKYPCIKNDDTLLVMLKDYQGFSGYAVLHICDNGSVFTKCDKRLKGDTKMATEDFKKVYSYKAQFSYKTKAEIFK